jgi:hypothetical protein
MGLVGKTSVLFFELSGKRLSYKQSFLILQLILDDVFEQKVKKFIFTCYVCAFGCCKNGAWSRHFLRSLTYLLYTWSL